VGAGAFFVGNAAEALDDVHAIFDMIGSPLWAEQTRAESASIGLRPSTTDLTPS
jgi:hypothetical protein